MESTLRPSRTRYGVIVFAVLPGIIHYIDRGCISKARPFIQEDLHFNVSPTSRLSRPSAILSSSKVLPVIAMTLPVES